MCYCCEECFNNEYIKKFIRAKGVRGSCDYCGSINSFIIKAEDLGVYVRECLGKAYEPLDGGTGAYLDPDDKEYCGRTGEPATRYSVIDVLGSEDVSDNMELLKDIMYTSGPSIRDIQQGEIDPYGDIYDECYVVKDDLEGVYGTETYYSWEEFKFIAKHYNRFFDVDGYSYRQNLLDTIKPLITEYESTVPINNTFYRARKINDEIDFDTFNINKELSPPPPKYTQTNRMSPAGISYLYVASTKETACEECRYHDEDVIIADYQSQKVLKIIDFSKKVIIPRSSIFDEDYNHDTHWLNTFVNLFVNEISKPINENESEGTRSYEYVATQLIAEYIRSLGYDDIGYKSSVGDGISYCFFCGPDLKFFKSDYGLFDDCINNYPTLPSFQNLFNIKSVELFHISNSTKLNRLKKRNN